MDGANYWAVCKRNFKGRWERVRNRRGLLVDASGKGESGGVVNYERNKLVA